MSPTSVFVTTVFLAGLGLFVPSVGPGTLQREDTRALDLAAIEKLHKADIEATLAQDPKFLSVLWSDDGVNLEFPGPAVVGTKAMQQAYGKFRTEHPDFQVLKYTPDIKDVQLADGWAIEWGYLDATFKISLKDNPVSVQHKVLRVLKRQTDGSWKFARVAETN